MIGNAGGDGGLGGFGGFPGFGGPIGLKGARGLRATPASGTAYPYLCETSPTLPWRDGGEGEDQGPGNDGVSGEMGLDRDQDESAKGSPGPSPQIIEMPTPTPCGAVEICGDGIDNDCDGRTDYGDDLDGDAFTTEQGDCEDCNPDIHPGAPTGTECSAWVDSDCDGITDDMECVWSPIVIDALGNGFNLTAAANGVVFDLNSDGIGEGLSWTSADSDDAWLALDRNDNGIIDSGLELFGNFTNQPTPPAGEERNGFLALAEFDKFEAGGNGDGFLTRKDLIFDSLRLWQDRNHNGMSEPSELFTLPQLGLRKIDLDYRESRRTDEHGNQFKYRAKVKDARDAQLGRWAWDVFLVRQP